MGRVASQGTVQLGFCPPAYPSLDPTLVHQNILWHWGRWGRMERGSPHGTSDPWRHREEGAARGSGWVQMGEAAQRALPEMGYGPLTVSPGAQGCGAQLQAAASDPVLPTAPAGPCIFWAPGEASAAEAGEHRVGPRPGVGEVRHGAGMGPSMGLEWGRSQPVATRPLPARCCSTWQQCSASWGSGPRPPTASRKPSPWGQKGPTTAWMLPRTTCR